MNLTERRRTELGSGGIAQIGTMREGLPPGVRNDPIRPRTEVAERCELWLGTPGGEYRISNKEW